MVLRPLQPTLTDKLMFNQKVHSDNKMGKIWEDTARHKQAVTGQFKKFNNMKRRLSAFFRFTQEEGIYANNRNSKGKLVPSLITLTYPSNDVWRPDHITKFLNTLRNHLKRSQGIKARYAWVAETTKQGVIHYHIVVWHLRKQRIPKPSEAGWWKHGRSKLEGVRKGVYGYLLKYISKGTDKIDGLGLYSERKDGKKQACRMFGYGGINKKDREFLSHQMLPHYVKDVFGAVPFGKSIKRITGGWSLDVFRKYGDVRTRIGKYWHVGKINVKSNYEGYWDQLNSIMIYEYGASWSSLREEEDLYLPF